MADETITKKVEAIAGDKRMLMFRIVAERPFKKAATLGLQISHEWTEERTSDQEQTKDGAVSSSGGMSEKISLEGLANKTTDPTATNVDKMLHHAFREGLQIEVWEIDFEQKNAESGEKTGKYWARHGEGKLASRGSTAGVEGNSDLKLEINIDGKSAFGWATVDAENEMIANQFFYDTIAKPEPVAGMELYNVQTKEEETP